MLHRLCLAIQGCGWFCERVRPSGAVDDECGGEEGVRVTYVIQSDLKGWFLAIIVNNAIGGSYVSFFEDAFGALEARGWKVRIVFAVLGL